MRVKDILNEGITKKSQALLNNYKYGDFFLANEKKVASFNKKFIREYEYEIITGMIEENDFFAVGQIASSGKWATDIDFFVKFLETIKVARDDGYPSRNYGAETVSEILANINWDHKRADTLYSKLKNSYTLEKVDFEYTDYSSENKAANKAEVDHIRSKSSDYRHD